MKSSKTKLALLIAISAGIVAWSPPAGEDFIVGTGNTVTNVAETTGVIGKSNYVTARSSLVVGETNTVTGGQSPYTENSIVAGTGNVLNGSNTRNLVSGQSNSVRASNSLVAGTTNTVRGTTTTTATAHSVAIGINNLVAAQTGWAVGSSNIVSGNRGVAIGSANQALALESAAFGSYSFIESQSEYSYALGSGLRVNQPSALALGTWNAPMVAGDVMVVGCGNPTTPTTAIRVTSDGGVILGRAQGDISMGAYQ